MAQLKFPQNRDVANSGPTPLALPGSVNRDPFAGILRNNKDTGRPRSSSSTAFSPEWLKYFNQVHKRLGGMDSVAAIATADIAAAGGAYNQAHIQTMVALLNEIKAQLNTITDTLKR